MRLLLLKNTAGCRDGPAIVRQRTTKRGIEPEIEPRILGGLSAVSAQISGATAPSQWVWRVPATLNQIGGRDALLEVAESGDFLHVNGRECLED